MFMAETLAYAFIGGVLGYIAGITGTTFMTQAGLMPKGFYPNYASDFVITTLGLMIAIVILSGLYPFLKAAKLVTPSLERRWKIETKPVGEKWTVPTPFVFTSNEEVEGILEYVKEYFMAYTTESAGFPFATTGVKKETGKTDEGSTKSLIIDAHVAPFPSGIHQTTTVTATRTDDRWKMHITIARKTGQMNMWITANRTFLDSVRKQLLMWRGLSPSEKEKYAEAGKETYTQKE